jgi:hypothetical protein
MTREPNGHCPACRRFIGPEDSCPFCDVDGITPLPFRLFKRLSIFLAMTALAILGLAAYRTQPPLIPIAEITPLMNHATVSIAGEVLRKPTTSTGGANPYAGFVVADSSGEIKVTAYGPIAETLIEQNTLPVKGDRIQVTGNLDIRSQTRRSLILRSTEHLTKLHAP